ncbi:MULTISPECIES: MlaD family protein [Tsukamurella]|uniref:MCE family protein n=2 Tax=Tsukamurella TaxID=2060 RepID=A0A5C5RZP8_9ACTN|nr:MULTISPECIES: MlaD family protein [Tsukamurella]NMD56002.1 MCE family protein [Tsukamurella columbiensis]TWS27928.1 MCE family protein [Tsukamurella conjunctivitidis]
MQALTLPTTLLRDGYRLALKLASGAEEAWARPSSKQRQLIFGVLGVAVAVIVMIASSVLAVRPLGTTTYTVHFPEAGMVRAGDDVRVAGVSVGSVQRVALEGDHVNVGLRIKKKVHIGDQSRVAVKMLTAVGGYFVDIDSLGTAPLGATAIPPSRVRIPYSLVETFQQADPKIRAIDPTPLRESLAQIQRATSGKPGQMKELLSTLQGVVQSISTQKDEVGGFVQTLSDYSAAIDRNGDVLTQVMRDMNIYFSTARLNVAGYKRFMSAFDMVLKRIIPAANFYQENLASMEAQFNLMSGQIGTLLTKYQKMIDDAMALLRRIQSSVKPDGTVVFDGSVPTLSSQYCIPLEGAPC